mgnify:CR=1 FL=1
MRAIEISSYGAPEVLREATRPNPVAGAGELLIRVTASGVNRPDVLQRKGHYAPPPGASDLPGLEVAGVVEGGDVAAMAAAGFKLGDRVCALLPDRADAAGATGSVRYRSSELARDRVHRLAERVRDRASSSR